MKISEAVIVPTRLRDPELVSDRLFIQEIMNDMARRGSVGTKAWDLLRDWSRELRNKSHMRGRTKRMFYEVVGGYLW